MQRLYELPDPEKMTRIHKKYWGISDEIDIGPVNTNIFATARNVRMVIVCESPSYAEVESGFPTVCATGARIFNNLVKARIIDPTEHSLPTQYCYLTHYKLFEIYGIYITNLVRFQADFGIKNGGDEKNTRVKKAWDINKKYLFEELSILKMKFGNTPVLIACGSAFKPQICEVVQKLLELNLPWFVTSHPSRSSYIYSDNYNPQKWSEPHIETTSLAKKIKKRISRVNQVDTTDPKVVR